MTLFSDMKTLESIQHIGKGKYTVTLRKLQLLIGLCVNHLTII